MPDLPAAVVFDCDGTLVDSERVSTAAMRDALAAMGHTLADRDVARLVGRSWADAQPVFRNRWGMGDAELDEYVERFRALAQPRFADPGLVFDDVRAVLDRLGEEGVPVGVCTSSRRRHLDTILGLSPLRDRFVVAVTAEDTERHKPDPLPYSLAIERIGAVLGAPVDAAAVAVVEDSHVGVTAAVAAGCWTVAVDRDAGLHDLSDAHVVVQDLTVSSLLPAW